MVDVNALDGVIHSCGLSQRKVAKAIGMNEQKFYRCMKRKEFGSCDIEKMMIFLNIDNPTPIFFSSVVT